MRSSSRGRGPRASGARRAVRRTAERQARRARAASEAASRRVRRRSEGENAAIRGIDAASLARSVSREGLIAIRVGFSPRSSRGTPHRRCRASRARRKIGETCRSRTESCRSVRSCWRSSRARSRSRSRPARSFAPRASGTCGSRRSTAISTAGEAFAAMRARGRREARRDAARALGAPGARRGVRRARPRAAPRGRGPDVRGAEGGARHHALLLPRAGALAQPASCASTGRTSSATWSNRATLTNALPRRAGSAPGRSSVRPRSRCASSGRGPGATASSSGTSSSARKSTTSSQRMKAQTGDDYGLLVEKAFLDEAAWAATRRGEAEQLGRPPAHGGGRHDAPTTRASSTSTAISPRSRSGGLLLEEHEHDGRTFAARDRPAEGRGGATRWRAVRPARRLRAARDDARRAPRRLPRPLRGRGGRSGSLLVAVREPPRVPARSTGWRARWTTSRRGSRRATTTSSSPSATPIRTSSGDSRSTSGASFR